MRTSPRARRCCGPVRSSPRPRWDWPPRWGSAELTVVPRQRVLVMSTGTELVVARHRAAARPDLRVQRGDAGRRGARSRRRGRRGADGRRRRRDSSGPRLRPTPADADLIITTGGVSAGAYEVVKDALGGGRGRVRQGGDAARDAAGRRAIGALAGDPRSSRCPVTRSARWCPSRCSSGPPLRAAMGLPARTAACAPPCSPRPDLAERQAAVPPRCARLDDTGGTVTTTVRRPRITCAGWPRRTACWRSPRTSPRWPPGHRSSVWDLL